MHACVRACVRACVCVCVFVASVTSRVFVPRDCAVSDTHELRFLPLDSVDYDRDQSYTVKVDCRDQYNVILLLVNVLIRIEPNIPPFFSVSHSQYTALFHLVLQSVYIPVSQSVYSPVSSCLTVYIPVSPCLTISTQPCVLQYTAPLPVSNRYASC